MRLHHHTTISVVLSAGVYLFSRSAAAALSCFLSGILIDLDHFFEFFYKFGFKKLSLKTFFRAAHNHEYDKFFLLLHSYELAIVFWLVSIFLIKKPWAWAFALGFTVHLLADQYYNPCHPLTYFLLFRIRHKFDGSRLFPREIQEKYRDKKRGWAGRRKAG